MEWSEIIGAILIAVLVGFLFYYLFKSKGPWGSAWTFILILFVGIWFLAALTDPIGPVYWNIAWLDFLIFALLFALLLSAATPTAVDRERLRKYYSNQPKETADPDAAAVAVGIWFWVTILFFFFAALAISAA